MEVKKVAIIEHVGGYGGMDYYDYGLAYGLALNGLVVDYHTCNQTKLRDFENVHTYFTFANIWDKNKWLKILLFFRLYLKAFFLAKKGGLQIVHLHIFDFTMRNLILVVFSKLFSFKLVLTVHDVVSFFGRSHRLSEKYILKWVDGVIVHNQSAYIDLKKRHTSNNILNRKDLAIIPHGNYLPFIEATEDFPKKAESLKILFFGQIKSVKGIEILLEALNIVIRKKHNIHLTIAGKPNKVDFELYSQLIKDLGIGKNVTTILRYISDDEIDDFYRTNDLVVLPYKIISQSGVLLLSMSYGLPVLTSDLPAFTEVIKDNINGFIFETEKPESLADKLVEISENRDLLNYVRLNSNKLIREEYDWGRIGTKTMKYYDQILNRK